MNRTVVDLESSRDQDKTSYHSELESSLLIAFLWK